MNEWIKALPAVVLYGLLIVFNAGMRGKTVEAMPNWLVMILIFLSKKCVPTAMNHFRGICLLHCLSKFYVSCLMNVAKRTTKLQGW